MSGEVIYVDFVKRVSRKMPKPDPKPSDRQSEKLQVFAQMLADGETTIGFDTRRKHVLVPPYLFQMVIVHLKWSHRYGLNDFEYDNDGVRGTLSFNGEPFYTIVPWSAVFEITNPKSKPAGKTWFEDLPPEMLQMLEPSRQIKPAPKTVKENQNARRESKVDIQDSPRVASAHEEGFCFRLGERFGRKIKAAVQRWL